MNIGWVDGWMNEWIQARWVDYGYKMDGWKEKAWIEDEYIDR